MSTDFCVVLTTFDDDAVGTNIIDALLSERLAACVQVQTIQSYYHWKGKVNCDAEKLVLIKTKRSLFQKVQESIIASHSYETPEIILLPIEDGYTGYLDWINKECQ